MASTDQASHRIKRIAYFAAARISPAADLDDEERERRRLDAALQALEDEGCCPESVGLTPEQYRVIVKASVAWCFGDDMDAATAREFAGKRLRPAAAWRWYDTVAVRHVEGRRQRGDCIRRPIGRAARAATNTRSRGSRRGSSGGGSPGDPDEPEPPGGRHSHDVGAAMQAVCFALHGGRR